MPDNKSKMEEFFRTHDASFIAEDGVFTDLSTGQEMHGRKAVAEMLNYMYHVAFDARAEVKSSIVTDKNAVLEATFIGKHIGEFVGMPATGKEVKVPLCVCYDLNDEGLIQNGRIYMLASVLFQQLQG